MALYTSVFESPLGPLTLLVSERGARAVTFGRLEQAEAQPDSKRTRDLARQLKEYFERKRRKFELELDWEGTEFQKKVWLALLKIGYGETASYAEIARAIRKPNAFRAVGGANRANPLAIVVPCHRVIGANGDLVGYGGRTGLDNKAYLLQLESGIHQLSLESKALASASVG